MSPGLLLDFVTDFLKLLHGNVNFIDKRHSSHQVHAKICHKKQLNISSKYGHVEGFKISVQSWLFRTNVEFENVLIQLVVLACLCDAYVKIC